MKRKLENAEDDLPEAKVQKVNLVDKLLKFLQNGDADNLTLDRVKNVFPDLSIPATLELLTTLKDEPTLQLATSYKLMYILTSHILQSEFKDTPESITCFCTLLIDLHRCERLPRMDSTAYINWLTAMDWNNPLVSQQVPIILDCLKLAFTRIRHCNRKNHINLDLLNAGLFSFINTLPDNDKNLDEPIRKIFAAIENFPCYKMFLGKFSIAALGALFIKYQTTNPEPEHAAKIANWFLNYLLNDEQQQASKEAIPSDIVTQALVSLAKVYCESALILFNSFFPNQYDKKPFITKPLQAESFQPMIESIRETYLAAELLITFLSNLGNLADHGLITGKFEHIEYLLRKIPIGRNTLFSEILTLKNIVPTFKTVPDIRILEKYLNFEILSESNKTMSLLLFTIDYLQTNGFVSGNISIDLFPYMDWIINKNPYRPDGRLLGHIARFIGGGLSSKQITTTSQPRLMKHLSPLIKTLYNHLDALEILHMKDRTNVFLGMKLISQSGQYSESFDERYLDSLLYNLIDNPERKISYSYLADCLYSISIAAKQGHIKNFRAETIRASFNVYNANVLPDVVFRLFAALANLLKHHALDNDLCLSFITMKVQYITDAMIEYLPDSIDSKQSAWQYLIADIPLLLEYPHPLKGQLLVALLPFMITILDKTPDKVAIEAILDGCREIIQSEKLYDNLPAMSTAAFNQLITLFYKVNGQAPHHVLSIAVLQYHLIKMKMLEGSWNLKLLLQSLVDICPESLISSNAARLQKNNGLIYEIDILAVLSEYLLKDIQEISNPLIADIFEAIQIIVQPKNQAEAITLQTDNLWIQQANKYMERKKYVSISPEKYMFFEQVFYKILSVSHLKSHQQISILQGLFSLLQRRLIRNFPAELLFAFFLRQDTETLSSISSLQLPLLLENEALSFKYPVDTLAETLMKKLVNLASTGNFNKIEQLCSKDSLDDILKALIKAAKTGNTEALELHSARQIAPMMLKLLVLTAQSDNQQALKELSEMVISNFLIQAASCGNIEEINLILPLIYQTKQACHTIQAACKVAADSASWPDVAQLLLKSPVFTDEIMQSILINSLKTIKHANSAERIILLLFRLVTYRGMDNDFVSVALTFMETSTHQLTSPYLPRLNNMIHHARALEKHSLFACTATQSQIARREPENTTIDFEDAEKILDCQNIFRSTP